MITRLLLVLIVLALPCSAASKKPKYMRSGNSQDVTTAMRGGFAFMGGGDDLDPAFAWMCELSGGGDFLILRARGNDEYNPYIRKLCKVNSAATLIIPTREAANDPSVADHIRKAEALFIAGGDQSNYIKYWKDSPVTQAIQDLIDRGVPIGGTSAGLAVLSDFVFSAMFDSAESEDTLKDPFNKRVTIARDFLKVPHMSDTIFDQHFITRDREGRLLGFMARIMNDYKVPQVRGIGVDEQSAVLMLPTGIMQVIGRTRGAYFYQATAPPATMKPLTWEKIAVYHAPPGANFDVTKWAGIKGEAYELSIDQGSIVLPLQERKRSK